MERRLRSKLGVTRENVVAEPAPTAELNMLLLPPEDIQDEPTIDVDPDYPDGKTVERLDSGSAKTKTGEPVTTNGQLLRRFLGRA